MMKNLIFFHGPLDACTESTFGPLAGLGTTSLSRTDRQSDRKRILKTPNLFSGAKKLFLTTYTLSILRSQKREKEKFCEERATDSKNAKKNRKCKNSENAEIH